MPVYGKSFFRNVLEAFADDTGIFAVYCESQPIAAGVGSWFRDTLNEKRALPDLEPTNPRFQSAIRIGQRLPLP